MKYSCVIVDDEPLAHEVLEGYISKFEELALAKKYFNAREAEIYLQANSVDLLFLDIQMPEMDGIAATRRIHETMSRASRRTRIRAA